MRGLLVVLSVLVAVATYADDLEVLKAAANRYVAGMKAVLALPDELDCSETIRKAGEYAAAKVAYYTAARNAMPALLQMAKGQKSDTGYGNELTEIFRGFGEDRDEEATGEPEDKLKLCPTLANGTRRVQPSSAQSRLASNSLRILAG